jgi:hypothetical protein
MTARRNPSPRSGSPTAASDSRLILVFSCSALHHPALRTDAANMASADFRPDQAPRYREPRHRRQAVGSRDYPTVLSIAHSPAPITCPGRSPDRLFCYASCFTEKPSGGVCLRVRSCASHPPNKNMNSRCTTAAFTLSPVPVGVLSSCADSPGDCEPSMRVIRPIPGLTLRASFQLFKIVPNDFVCSSARAIALRLPPDIPSRSCPWRLVNIGPKGGHFRYSHRGLSPHQIMPMSGAHKKGGIKPPSSTPNLR